MSDIVIYSSNYCGYCFRAKALLKKKNVSFKEIIIDMNSKARAEMRSRSGGGTSVPQIIIGGEPIGGCDELHALESAGKLDALLKLA